MSLNFDPFVWYSPDMIIVISSIVAAIILERVLKHFLKGHLLGTIFNNDKKRSA